MKFRLYFYCYFFISMFCRNLRKISINFGKGLVGFKEIRRKAELKAPGILARVPVKVPLLTGTKVIDSLIPIGRGQRELIIGDRQTGKTSIGMDIIITSVNTNLKYRKCKNNIDALREVLWFVYCFIGQKSSTILEVISEINKKKPIGLRI